MQSLKKFIDIGANLTDSMYAGVYNGTKKHDSDLPSVLQRSWEAGLQKMIITGGCLSESIKALEIANTDDRLYATVGCHPTRCLEFEQNDPTMYLNNLKSLAHDNVTKVVAIGECGLDYYLLRFCPKEVQKKYFQIQLSLSEALDLPLFLHCRNAAADLYDILKSYKLRGVVHSFDGTFDEAQKFIDLGYYIGLNGCSLKTKDNLETVQSLPAGKILFETDCPWCEIRPSHAGYPLISKENLIPNYVKKEKWQANCLVKSRNEPINIRQILDVVSSVKNMDPIELSEIVFKNSKSLFFPKEQS